MASVALKSTSVVLGPDANGISMGTNEFDSSEFDRDYRYDLVRGIVIVSPSPSRKERDPNEELGFLLRSYKRTHPDGRNLDATYPEETISVGNDRRRVDRAIWVGEGSVPAKDRVPSIIVEFVSAGKRNWTRDYEEKRDQFLSIEVAEYWVFDRFARTLTVFKPGSPEVIKSVYEEDATYQSELLPGFDLALSELFACVDQHE